MSVQIPVRSNIHKGIAVHYIASIQREMQSEALQTAETCRQESRRTDVLVQGANQPLVEQQQSRALQYLCPRARVDASIQDNIQD